MTDKPMSAAHRTYSHTLDGHGVGRHGARFQVYYMAENVVDHEIIATLSNEAGAWSFCDRLRNAYRRGMKALPSIMEAHARAAAEKAKEFRNLEWEMALVMTMSIRQKDIDVAKKLILTGGVKDHAEELAKRRARLGEK